MATQLYGGIVLIFTETQKYKIQYMYFKEGHGTPKIGRCLDIPQNHVALYIKENGWTRNRAEAYAAKKLNKGKSIYDKAPRFNLK